MDFSDILKLVGGGNAAGGGLSDMIGEITRPLHIMAEGIASIQAGIIELRAMLADVQATQTEQGQQLATLLRQLEETNGN